MTSERQAREHVAGGHGSYMSVMPLANSLMLDFRCVIVPRFVYATGGDFDLSPEADPPEAEGTGLRPGVLERITHLTHELTRIGAALAGSEARASKPLGD